MRKKVLRTKRYDVDWIRNGFCYRTTMDCPWEAVLEAKITAKWLGEKIEYRFSHYKNEVYIL